MEMEDEGFDDERLLDRRDEEGGSLTRKNWMFWVLGLLNNSSYVIMIASAKSISNGGVGLVYLAGIGPGSMLKASSPFWFDVVGYRTRLMAATILMAASFALVGLGGSLLPELLGVACCSAQSALGEASLLALASRFPNRGARAIASWSSGTGFAGVFGYVWVVVLSKFGASQLLALVTLPASYAVASLSLVSSDLGKKKGQSDDRPCAVALGAKERLKFAWSLYPVTGAIFAVYFAEYAMQSGVWAAMGFPVASKSKRNQFYELSNTLYQCGVLVSRSSGFFLLSSEEEEEEEDDDDDEVEDSTSPSTRRNNNGNKNNNLSRRTLWGLAGLQGVLLIFFFTDAAQHFEYNPFFVYPLCLAVGLLGGTVYVFGFRRLAATVECRGLTETAMACGAFAADAGILLSNAAGVFIQSCLYERNHIDGAVVPSSLLASSLFVCKPRRR